MRPADFCVFGLGLLLIGMAPTDPLRAQGAGPSASGHANLRLGDGTLLTASFTAVTHQDGAVTGEMEFHDRESLPDQDVDGTGDPELGASLTGVTIHADINCLLVEGNRAVIGGVIGSSSISRYVGKVVLLALEDNGEESNAVRDGFTWGFYRPEDGVGCQTFPLAAYSFTDIEGGNVQVRPLPAGSPTPTLARNE